MSVRTDARSGNWLPSPGRIVTCRRSDCAAEAADPIIQLCERHRAAYELTASRTITVISKAKPAGMTR
jgi:hypothetical protein